MKGRIWFARNPWPEGHRLKAFLLMGRVDLEKGLFLDVELVTDEYSAERDPEDDEDASDWEAPIVWNNYHRCTISSVNWENETGLLVATERRKLEKKAFSGSAKWVDLAKHTGDSRALHVYLLGHDSVRSGDLRLKRKGTSYDVTWTGKLALTYAGDSVFRHRFSAKASGVAFTGFELPEGANRDDAETVASRFAKPGVLVAKKAGGRWRLVPR